MDPDPEKWCSVNGAIVLQTDASGKGISGVLSVCRNSTEQPVAFFSRQLKNREWNYSATELECLAVKASVQHFEIYLYSYRPHPLIHFPH